MSVGRIWKLWAHHYKDGKFWNIGQRRWVEIHQLPHPIVPVLVEEILGDPYADKVTHYGWQHAEDSRYRKGDVPSMIQIRTGNDPKDPKRAQMFLNMCFAYGVQAAIDSGEGTIIALRITERPEDA